MGASTSKPIAAAPTSLTNASPHSTSQASQPTRTPKVHRLNAVSDTPAFPLVSLSPDTDDAEIQSGLSATHNPDLFVKFGPAFFSPSDTCQRASQKWRKHGGTILPNPPSLIYAHSAGYLNIPPSALDELESTAQAATYVFVTPDDPILHLFRDPYLIPFNAKWVEDSVNKGKLLPLEGHILPMPITRRLEMEQAHKVLDKLAEAWRSGTGRSDGTSAIPIASLLRNPIFARSSRNGGGATKRYIVQPYLQLDLPAASIENRPSTPAPPLTDKGDVDHTQTHLKRGERLGITSDFRPPYTLRTPLSLMQNNILPGRDQRLHAPSTSTKPPCANRPAQAFTFTKQPTEVPSLPSLTYHLEADFSPAFSLGELDEEQLRRLMQEMVNQANEGIAEDFQVWDDQLGEMIPLEAELGVDEDENEEQGETEKAVVCDAAGGGELKDDVDGRGGHLDLDLDLQPYDEEWEHTPDYAQGKTTKRRKTVVRPQAQVSPRVMSPYHKFPAPSPPSTPVFKDTRGRKPLRENDVNAGGSLETFESRSTSGSGSLSLPVKKAGSVFPKLKEPLNPTGPPIPSGTGRNPMLKQVKTTNEHRAMQYDPEKCSSGNPRFNQFRADHGDRNTPQYSAYARAGKHKPVGKDYREVKRFRV